MGILWSHPPYLVSEMFECSCWGWLQSVFINVFPDVERANSNRWVGVRAHYCCGVDILNYILLPIIYGFDFKRKAKCLKSNSQQKSLLIQLSRWLWCDSQASLCSITEVYRNRPQSTKFLLFSALSSQQRNIYKKPLLNENLQPFALWCLAILTVTSKVLPLFFAAPL